MKRALRHRAVAEPHPARGITQVGSGAPSARFGLPVGLVSAAVIAILVGSVLAMRLADVTVGAPAASAVGGSDSAPGQPVELARVALPGPVYDLAYDHESHAIWFPFLDPDGDDLLYRFDIGAGRLSSWPLPSTTHNGFLGRIAIGLDGSIWLTAEYRLLRFDPTTESLAVREFEPADSDATPSALKPEDPSPGTWPAAIGFDTDGSALISRHNVRSLIRMDESLRARGRVPLPPRVVGPGDIARVDRDLILATYAGSGQAAQVRSDGGLVRNLPATSVRVVAAGNRVLSVGTDGAKWLATDGSDELVLSIGGSLEDRGAPTSDGAVIYREGTGTIERYSNSGDVHSVFEFPRETFDEINPMGEAVTVFANHRVGGLAVDNDDNTWYVDITQPALVQLSL